MDGGLGKDWASYAKASIAECSSKSRDVPKSMKWLVDGVVPEGAGLSVSRPVRRSLVDIKSSAAFVVASVLAVSVANDTTSGLNQSDVVKLALKSEHRLGLINGGMDVSSRFCFETSKSFSLMYSKLPRYSPYLDNCAIFRSIPNCPLHCYHSLHPWLWSSLTLLNRMPLRIQHPRDTT